MKTKGTFDGDWSRIWEVLLVAKDNWVIVGFRGVSLKCLLFFLFR